MKRSLFLLILFLAAVCSWAETTAAAQKPRHEWTSLVLKGDSCPTRPYYSRPAVQMNLEIGSGYHFLAPYTSEHYDLIKYNYGVPVTLDFQVGCRVNDVVFVGGGIMQGVTFYSKEGYQYDSVRCEYEDRGHLSTWLTVYLPVYACSRFYIPTRNYKVQPYFDLALGYSLFGNRGFGRASMGLEYNRFTWALGYSAFFSSTGLESMAELKLGFRFGPVR